MATKKKMLQAAAGNAGGAGLNVEDVFSTYLYEGTYYNEDGDMTFLLSSTPITNALSRY